MGKSGCILWRVGDWLKEAQQEEVWDSAMVKGALGSSGCLGRDPSLLTQLVAHHTP